MIAQVDPITWLPLFKLDVLGRLLLAAVLGGAIGLERELSDKPAGLRTNLLICVGAALLTEISIAVAVAANAANAAQGLAFRADPARIAAQIVSGIGFLGAGTIIQSRGHVTGLTTAATLWVVAAIGMAVGSRAYVEAIGSTLLVYLALVFLERLENLVIRQHDHRRYSVVLAADPSLVESVEQSFRTRGVEIENATVDRQSDQFEISLDATTSPDRHTEILQDLLRREGVRRVSQST